jgi:serine/threonine-protein kinase HipA
MNDIEVHIEIGGTTSSVGTLHRNATRGSETATFSYDAEWLDSPVAFSLEPGLALTRGVFAPQPGRRILGSIGDSAPDSWGRQLMRRAERMQARSEGRAVRTLSEVDFLLGVIDVARMGALRFRRHPGEPFQAPAGDGVPPLVQLRKLLQISDRIAGEEESEEDMRIILGPGSSLGGARPKASVLDGKNRLAIAKFPKESDDYSIEMWEEVALRLAEEAGIVTPDHELVTVAGRPVLLSRRFDREGGNRIPFLSAMSMMGMCDGEEGSYPEMVDALTRHGAQADLDARALYRRMVFNILVSNLDDHLRNHGFVWKGHAGWALSPVYDLNPVPTDIRPRILTTRITLEDGTCSIELAETAAEYFGMGPADARDVIREVATVTARWRGLARAVGAGAREIDRMASAFEHDDLARALTY